MAPLPGLELPVCSIATATGKIVASYAMLREALTTGDHGKMRDAADALRNEASRIQALSAVVSRHIIEHRTRHVRSV